MRVLITGGAGFIGSHTADRLISEGHQVRVLDLLDPQVHDRADRFPSYLHPDVECIRGDLCDPLQVSNALQDMDAVLHLAALTGVGQSMYEVRRYVHTNVLGTATLLEEAVKKDPPLSRFILGSSRAVYGEGTHLCPTHGILFPGARSRKDLERGLFSLSCPTCGASLRYVATQERRELNPLSLYAWTKKQQEDLCGHAADTFGLPLAILRYFNVYGSRQSLRNPYTGVVSVFFSRIAAGRPIEIYENGVPTRDFVHVSDIAQANLMALTRGLSSDSPVNVGSGRASSLLDVVKGLERALGVRATLRVGSHFRVGDICACTADLSQASRLLGYRPQVSLRQGLEEFAQWAIAQEPVDRYEDAVRELERYGLFG